MVMVVIFIVLFTAMLGVVFRELAGALQVETLHKLEVQRDTGTFVALSQALALLQTGLPPTNPYECSVTINTATGPQAFNVTFTSPDEVNWQVQTAPSADGPASQPMPAVFGTPDVAP